MHIVTSSHHLYHSTQGSSSDSFIKHTRYAACSVPPSLPRCFTTNANISVWLCNSSYSTVSHRVERMNVKHMCGGLLHFLHVHLCSYTGLDTLHRIYKSRHTLKSDCKHSNNASSVQLRVFSWTGRAL